MLVLCAFSSKELRAVAVTCKLWRGLVMTAVSRILQERHDLLPTLAADPTPEWPWEMVSTNGGVNASIRGSEIDIWQSDSWKWPKGSEHGPWPKGMSVLRAVRDLPADRPCAWKIHVPGYQWHFQVGLAASCGPRPFHDFGGEAVGHFAMLHLGLAEIATPISSIPVEVGGGEDREELLEGGGDLILLFWKQRLTFFSSVQQRAVTIQLPAAFRAASSPVPSQPLRYRPVIETWREVPGDAGERCPAQRFVMSRARPIELLRVIEALPAEDDVLGYD